MSNVKAQMSNQAQNPNEMEDTLHTGGQDKKQTRHNNQYSISETTD
jgi:hypothetical protein